MTRDEVFNIGFSVPGNILDIATAFINGKASQTMGFAPQPPAPTLRTGIAEGDILLGSAVVDESADGVVISDVVFWTRALVNAEGHRFPGYTGKILPTYKHLTG